MTKRYLAIIFSDSTQPITKKIVTSRLSVFFTSLYQSQLPIYATELDENFVKRLTLKVECWPIFFNYSNQVHAKQKWVKHLSHRPSKESSTKSLQ